MSVKLSHTAKEMYLLSPRKYFYHYMLYLRPIKADSALFFGSMIEHGIEALLAGKTLDQAKETFTNNFKFVDINGKKEDLVTSDKINYSKADLDPDVFTEEETNSIIDKSPQYQSHKSLMKKGLMLIEAYSKEILPKIKKVIATQVPFTIDNGIGDQITGFADLICEWEDGKTYVLDHKTSSIKYPDDAVQTEQYGKQTALYFDTFKDKYKIDGAGFIVLEKKMRKKEPRARVYATLFQVPSEQITEKTFDEFENVLYNIKQGQFPCCTPNCDAYGKQCVYKKYCDSGGENLTGLVKLNGYKK